MSVTQWTSRVIFVERVKQGGEIEKGWQADAGATASAGKESAEGKTNFVNGLAIYQLTKKGLMLNADIAGTKYWQDDDLNE